MSSATRQIRFMNNNFISRSFTYSSQVSAFPASNAYNSSRSKVWKPGGNFTVVSSNKVLYVNDGGDLTITLTEGSYTYATLATHIQTKLNASSSNWTCSYDFAGSTFKFTISRSSGTAHLRLSSTTDAAWDMLGFTGTTDLTTSPFVAMEQRNHTEEWLQCDVGVPQNATFGALIGPIGEVLNLSNTANLRLQANNIDYWIDPPVDIAMSLDSQGSFQFLDDTVTDSYRYWRIYIKDRLNYRGPQGIKIAHAYIGSDVTLTGSNIGPGFGKTLVDPSLVQYSESGAAFYEVRTKYLSIPNMSIQLLSGSEQRELEQLFYDLGVQTPFYVSLDPKLEVSNSLQELTRYVLMQRPVNLQHIIRDYYSFSMEMREAF